MMFAVAGYSGTPLAKKLGIKAGANVCLSHAPKHYGGLVAPLPDGVRLVGRVSRRPTSSAGQLKRGLKSTLKYLHLCLSCGRGVVGAETAGTTQPPVLAGRPPEGGHYYVASTVSMTDVPSEGSSTTRTFRGSRCPKRCPVCWNCDGGQDAQMDFVDRSAHCSERRQ